MKSVFFAALLLMPYFSDATEVHGATSACVQSQIAEFEMMAKDLYETHQISKDLPTFSFNDGRYKSWTYVFKVQATTHRGWFHPSVPITFGLSVTIFDVEQNGDLDSNLNDCSANISRVYLQK